MTQAVLSVDPPCLWKPSNPDNTEMERFRKHVNSKFNLSLEDYQALWRWSTSSVSDFWSTVWDYTNVISSTRATQVLDTSVPMDQVPEWFKGARLNFAENLLWCRDPERIAIKLLVKDNHLCAISAMLNCMTKYDCAQQP